MSRVNYAQAIPLADFDWDLYENGYNGTNLKVNLNVSAKRGEKVFCHESYAQDLYDRIEAHFQGKTYTPKDQISGTVYKVNDIESVSGHEIRIDTDGGMSAIIDMTKEHQFLDSIGCNGVNQFMIALKDPELKETILQHAKNVKVVSNRVSIWEGVRANIENGMMEQLKTGTQRYGYPAHVLSVNNGGYTVDVNGIKCFLPGSLASSGPIDDFESLVGKTINVCVVNFSKQTNNFVVSHKKYLELTLPARVRNEFEPGMVVSVKVTGQSKNGLFCAIKDKNGDYPFASLMHRSTMSPDWESSFDKGEFVNGDMFNAYIHRIVWTDNYNYRIVIGDKPPKLDENNEEDNE